MGLWTLSVLGIAVLPVVGLALVLIDIYAAHVDLVKVRWWYPPPSIEHEQASSIFWGQIARAVNLVLLSTLAVWYLLPFHLARSGIAGILYAIIIIKIADAYRARRTRKKMVMYLSDSPESGFTDEDKDEEDQ